MVRLQPSRGHAHRTAAFCRFPLPFAAGVLEIREGRTPDDPAAVRSRYALREVRLPGDDWRRFRLTKADGSRYYVGLGSVVHECDCTGHLRYGICKHVSACVALRGAGEL